MQARAEAELPVANEVPRLFLRLVPQPRKRGRLLRNLLAIIRCEALGLREMARRADRALRSSHARTIGGELGALQLDQIANRTGWTRISEREFVCRFGSRRRTVLIPRGIDSAMLASMLARAEVHVLLGDAPLDMVLMLQSIAEREVARSLAR